VQCDYPYVAKFPAKKNLPREEAFGGASAGGIGTIQGSTSPVSHKFRARATCLLHREETESSVVVLRYNNRMPQHARGVDPPGDPVFAA
jgi:hypothetical protein